MDNSTSVLINRIQEELFTEEQKGLLSYTVGQVTMTIANQLEMRYGDFFPRYPIDKCILIGAEIVKNNQRLMLIIAKEGDFIKALSNPDNFKNIKFTYGDKSNKKDKRTFKDVQKIREDVATIKNRGGAAARSFDYAHQEESWWAEDQAKFSSEMDVSIKRITGTDLSTSSIQEVPVKAKPTAPTTDVQVSTEPPEQEELVDPYWNTLEVSQAGSKSNRKQITTLDLLDQGLTSDVKEETQSTFSYALNVINASNLDLPMIRDKFFNSFHVLFSEYPLCL